MLNIYDWVEERGFGSQSVADRFDLDLADVYAVLTYYHENPAEMKSLREARETALEWAQSQASKDRLPGVNPR